MTILKGILLLRNAESTSKEPDEIRDENAGITGYIRGVLMRFWKQKSSLVQISKKPNFDFHDPKPQTKGNLNGSSLTTVSDLLFSL
jgi:hypothetical protein